MEIIVVAKKSEHDPIKIEVYKCQGIPLMRAAVKNYIDYLDASQPEMKEIDKVVRGLVNEGIYEIDAGDVVLTFQLFNTDITNAMGQLS